jgi:hypothetical protein
LTKVLHKLGDASLEAEVHRLRTLTASENQVVEGICQMENDLFYARLRKQECERRLEDADVVRRLQEAEEKDQGVMRVSAWEVERESHTISRREGDPHWAVSCPRGR